MAWTRSGRPTGDVLKKMISIVETTARRHAIGLAADEELAIARGLVVPMLASADLGESFVTNVLSQGVWTDVDRLRRACHQYERRLWQTAPAFLLAQ